MLIQSIRVKSFNDFNKVKQNENKAKSNFDEENYSNVKLMSYSTNYYFPLTFCKKLSNKELIQRIGIENFPSQNIAEIMLTNPQKSLYEAHKEHYADLLTCKTLKEAKIKYPEFECVRDTQEINIDTLNKNGVLYKIATGKIKGINYDTLSLDILKKYYGELKSITDKKSYFGLAHNPIYRMFDEEQLNIKIFNKKYIQSLWKSNPAYKEYMSQEKIELYESEEGDKVRKKISDKLFEINKTEERKKSFEERSKWRREYNKTPQGQQSLSEGAKKRKVWINSNEGQMQIIENTQRLNDWRKTNDGDLLSLSNKLSWFYNPEFRNTMSKIAENYPNLGKLIVKQKNDTITNVEYYLLRQYHQKCEMEMPKHKKEIIGPINSLIYEELTTKMKKVKERTATDEDLIILSSYYMLTKAQAPEYLDCFAEVEDTLLKNKGTFNEAVDIMSDYYENLQGKYDEEFVDKYFGGLKKVLN